MAEALIVNLRAQLDALLTNPSNLDNPQCDTYLPTLLALALASGTGAGKANQIFRTQRVLASAGNDSVSVYNAAINGGGAGADPLGGALLFANVKLLIIQNLSATETDYLSVGGDGTAAAWVSPFGSNTDIVKILGGTSLVLAGAGAAGYAVVNATNHLLKIHNSGAANVTYNLIIIGATA